MQYAGHPEPFPGKERNDCRFPEQALGFAGLPALSQSATHPAAKPPAEASSRASPAAAPVRAPALPGVSARDPAAEGRELLQELEQSVAQIMLPFQLCAEGEAQREEGRRFAPPSLSLPLPGGTHGRCPLQRARLRRGLWHRPELRGTWASFCQAPTPRT